MIHTDRCPICHSTHLQQRAHKGIDQEVMFGRMNELDIILSKVTLYDQCLTCGVYFQNPRWTDEEIRHYYTKGVYRSELKMDEDSQSKDEAERALRIAATIRKHVGDGWKHLDVGAGRGYLLREVNSKFPIAVEPDDTRLEYVKPFRYDSLEEVNEGHFDLITCIHALEHMTDPMNALSEMKQRLVRWHGRLVIEVPSDRSPGGWARPAHTFHFPSWTLHRMADRLDMEIIHLEFAPHLLTIWKGKEDAQTST